MIYETTWVLMIRITMVKENVQRKTCIWYHIYNGSAKLYSKSLRQRENQNDAEQNVKILQKSFDSVARRQALSVVEACY